jgi:Zn-finger protein/DNA-binding CsgD family transcriptional regulator
MQKQEEGKTWIDGDTTLARVSRELFILSLSRKINDSDVSFASRWRRMQEAFTPDRMPDQEEYRRILNSEEYRAHRAQLVAEKENCELCYTPFFYVPKTMHHLNYYRVGGNETSDDVVILCGTCHVLVHRPGSAAHLQLVLNTWAEITKEVFTVEGLPGKDFMKETLTELFPMDDLFAEPADTAGYITGEPFEWRFMLLDSDGEPVTVTTPQVYVMVGDGIKPLPNMNDTKYVGQGWFNTVIPGDMMVGGQPITLFAVVPGADEYRETINPRGWVAPEPSGVSDPGPGPFRCARLEVTALPESGHGWDPETTYAIMVCSGLEGMSNAEIGGILGCDGKRISNKLSAIRYGHLRKREQTQDIMRLRDHLIETGVWTQRSNRQTGTVQGKDST